MTYEQVLKEYLLITDNKYKGSNSEDDEQITYEDEDFDKWDMDSDIRGNI